MRARTKPMVSLMVALVLVGAACSGDEADRMSEPTALDRQATSFSVEGSRATASQQEGFNSIGGTDTVNDEPYDLVFLENYGVNPRIDTEDDPFSTFAVDVDTGSYTVGRRWLRDGNLPDKDGVRVEEYVNFFDHDYQAPDEAAFAIHLEGAPTPFVENDCYQMLRIGIQGHAVPDDERKPANLTFVIDVSGSMDREDRLGTVKESLRLLIDQLRPSDQVSLVVYGDRGRVVLEPTAVEERRILLRAIEELQPGGSTNAEEGLVLGYEMARKAFTEGAINRVVLASDGVANVGNTGARSILDEIEDAAGEGIQLVTVGYGMGNYNDVLMEQIADEGDGVYAYVDDLKEAERLFVHGLTGTLQTIAEDVKVQVEFNPETVERYRLLGFENRAIDDDAFRDDSIDAGEIGSGHSVTALYEVKLAENADGSTGIATVFLRWRDPDGGETVEMQREIVGDAFASDFLETSPTFRLATVVGAYAEVLRDSYWAQHLDLEMIAAEAGTLADGPLGADEAVRELAQLVDRAATISG